MRCALNPNTENCPQCTAAAQSCPEGVNPEVWITPCDCQCQSTDGRCGGCQHRNCGMRGRRSA